MVEQAEEFQPSFFHLYTVVDRMRLSSILFTLFFAFYLFIFTFYFYFSLRHETRFIYDGGVD